MKNLKTIFAALILISNSIKSQDYWNQLNTPPDVEIRSIAVNSSNHIFIGLSYSSSGGGVYRSIDIGNTWEYVGLENTILSLIINNEDFIYAATNRIYFSINNGNEWDTLSEVINPIRMFANHDTILVGFWGGIYKTDNHGLTWDQVLYLQNTEVVNTIIQNETSFDLYAGSTNFIGGGGVYRSADGGNIWEHIGLSDHYVSSLAFNSSGDLFAGTRGHHYLYSGGVFLLPNGELEWINLNDEELVTSMVINSEGEIYIGCSTLDFNWGGVRRSTDNGQTWEDISLVPMYDRDIEIIILDAEEHLYALEFNSPTPLYKSINSTITTINDKPIGQNVISYNYPNPFNGTTLIWFKLENESSVMINIYDYTGKRIKSFDQGMMDKGSHCVEFSSDGLTSGIYFYGLEVNGKVIASKKMTIVK